MNLLLEELTGGVEDWTQLFRVLIRLAAAMVLGTVIGAQREHAGKPAGLRTHMLVAMGSALFVVGCSMSGMAHADLSRVIQGIATGVGFIGAGAILKHRQSGEIEGLTTAAGLWMTAAAGVAAGLGCIGLAVTGTLLAWAILSLMAKIELRTNAKSRAGAKHTDED